MEDRKIDRISNTEVTKKSGRLYGNNQLFYVLNT